MCDVVLLDLNVSLQNHVCIQQISVANIHQ